MIGDTILAVRNKEDTTMAAYNGDHLKSETLPEMLGQSIRRLRRQ